ncbi:TetR/AcrR family transcriptional regulator [Mycobacterium sp. CPCC 205372]|uniref:TetR/AcrR family transcriptional regulator n=1 Tax=Mycobacterium hippophais TaxID=3016340 RepID=A0ABT4PX26_9MYCO|nr:TetR/AcrR family transcriptional regulator [Mycobacterium hippophais]MCZ8381119.1 TetR/AcrR family transcriptional regulator [Mycobacterium hippophais]
MPRYDAQHKAETRRRIIDTASARIKRDGIDGSGVATLMSDAGLTNGAFYAHFPSKSDLVANVLADQLRIQHERLSTLQPGRPAIEEYVREYLSPYHRDHPESGCPNAALLDEVCRCDDAVRQSYTEGMQAIVNGIATNLSPANPAGARATALGLFTILIATLQLARAVSDPALSDEILAAGVSNALTLVDAGPAQS